MLRCGPAILVAWMILMSAAPAEAQWFTNFWDGMRTGYRRNKMWPEPFLQADRESANLPFSIMVANGWRRQNLLSDYHFNDGNQQLNQAGAMKLRFILTQMPPQRRTIFVQQGLTNDVTAVRIRMAQKEAAKILPPGYLADVVESDLPNDGWPADEIDAVAKSFQKSRPEPRLKKEAAADSASGGSQ
jgi:hypothetical protein